jgi:hypothetical protein
LPTQSCYQKALTTPNPTFPHIDLFRQKVTSGYTLDVPQKLKSLAIQNLFYEQIVIIMGY